MNYSDATFKVLASTQLKKNDTWWVLLMETISGSLFYTSTTGNSPFRIGKDTMSIRELRKGDTLYGCRGYVMQKSSSRCRIRILEASRVHHTKDKAQR